MLLLEAADIEKQYGERLIIKVKQLQVYKGNCIGVVGKNGAGKSTLLKLLAGEIEADKGKIRQFSRPAYIPQLEVVTEGKRSMGSSSRWGVPDYKEGLSGGEQTRKKIAAAFASNAGIIFADEPTSHLDVEGVSQLEEEMNVFTGAFVLISHDRTLLDNMCTSIWEVEHGNVNEYEGNYTDYLNQKKLEIDRDWFEYKQYKKEEARLLAAKQEKSEHSKSLKKAPKRMGNSEARLHKRSVGQKKTKLDKGVKAIQSRIDQLEKKEKPSEESAVTFDIAEFPPIHSRTVLAFENLEVKAGHRVLFSGFTASVKPGSKVAITGRNGSGKSTLLKLIAGGTEGIRAAKPVKLGFFYQQLENLEEEKTILENILESSRYSETFIRTVLARLQFKREEVFKPVWKLSGGERVKAALAKVFLGDYNVLLLDEPTNFLDLQAKEALQEILSQYPGTILFVTHDRYFIKHLADEVIEIKGGKAELKGRDSINKPFNSGEQAADEVSSLTLDLKLTEILGKLAVPANEEEKKELEKKYAQLMQKKKSL
ncbi:ribosomal protection-like ABC-F family protein [Salipaludibacillus aurantiacus]|uniref:Macrolide transport system ATP-binding/permease protein n=1 Tax=Salipaludibacillus aurantiacus TaxID=1601833 RepID=A0A1H9S998_9BACI|nr:ABC-F type ribosomal protection protein [Salipaludibacillus aurantiacus]SER81616.1 macrolide transport system ATP-binding/permease protein [Salipaludibacillus aurantiacus]